LPVTRLNFGRTQLATSSGVHTLGRLVCSGSVAITGFPTSCEDLLLIGHTLNGFYSVKGTKMIESVYCDFTKLPSDSGKYSLLIYLFLIYFINKTILAQKDFKNGSDTSTSNRRPSISTSSAIYRFPQLELQFRSIWRE
jgi:hypothetical protein